MTDEHDSMINTVNTKGALLLIVTILLTACQTIEGLKQGYELKDTLRHYANSFRWTQLNEAYDYLTQVAAAESEFPENPDNIKVTSYQVVKAVVQSDETHAEQTVQIEFVFEDMQRVRKITDHQLWEYDGITKLWMRANAMPVFE